jgi:hypothetical protein
MIVYYQYNDGVLSFFFFFFFFFLVNFFVNKFNFFFIFMFNFFFFLNFYFCFFFFFFFFFFFLVRLYFGTTLTCMMMMRVTIVNRITRYKHPKTKVNGLIRCIKSSLVLQDVINAMNWLKKFQFIVIIITILPSKGKKKTQKKWYDFFVHLLFLCYSFTIQIPWWNHNKDITW